MNSKLQWLVLPDVASATYTNFGDGRPGDASELVTRVNADQSLGKGHSDWRLPTLDELKSLVGTPYAPTMGLFWSSSSPYVGNADCAWGVNFRYDIVVNGFRDYLYFVLLVRAS